MLNHSFSGFEETQELFTDLVKQFLNNIDLFQIFGKFNIISKKETLWKKIIEIKPVLCCLKNE